MTDAGKQEAGPRQPSKEDPETLVLRGIPPKVIRFRRNAIIGLSATASIVLAGLAWYAMMPVSLSVPTDQPEDKPVQTRTPGEAVKDAPATYSDVPELGPPLPGDLGRPILAHQRSLGMEPGTLQTAGASQEGPDPAAAERQRRGAEQQAARTSSVLVALARKSADGSGSTEPVAQAAAVPDADTPDPSGILSVQSKQAEVSAHAIRNAPSPWTISAGTIIAASLITGLNSDLPGMVVAQVTEHVHDSATGRTLLIPQGSRLIGQYESNVAYRQRRALVVWRRIIWPDGASLTLDDMPATDGAGQAGIADRVDFHGGALLKGVALSTLLGVGTELSFGDDEDELVRAVREAAQRDGARAGDQIVRRSLDIQPTIRVRPGWPVRVLVDQDLVLKPWVK